MSHEASLSIITVRSVYRDKTPWTSVSGNRLTILKQVEGQYSQVLHDRLWKRTQTKAEETYTRQESELRNCMSVLVRVPKAQYSCTRCVSTSSPECGKLIVWHVSRLFPSGGRTRSFRHRTAVQLLGLAEATKQEVHGRVVRRPRITVVPRISRIEAPPEEEGLLEGLFWYECQVTGVPSSIYNCFRRSRALETGSTGNLASSETCLWTTTPKQPGGEVFKRPGGWHRVSLRKHATAWDAVRTHVDSVCQHARENVGRSDVVKHNIELEPNPDKTTYPRTRLTTTRDCSASFATSC